MFTKKAQSIYFTNYPKPRVSILKFRYHHSHHRTAILYITLKLNKTLQLLLLVCIGYLHIYCAQFVIGYI